MTTQIGDKIWVYGSRWGGSKYHEYTIVSETSRSWILSGREGIKVSKKALAAGELFPNVARTLEEIERSEWVERNAWRIADKMRYLKDYDKLQAIAEIVGYTEAVKA